MSSGTDLSLLYGDIQEQQQFQHPSQVQSQHSQHSQQQLLQKPAIQQAQVPPDVEYNVPEPVYQQQTPTKQQPQVAYSEPSIWEKMGDSKSDVFKLFMFALVILMAISIDRFIFHYIRNYIDENVMNTTNEFLFRLSYPVAILVVVWLLKSL